MRNDEAASDIFNNHSQFREVVTGKRVGKYWAARKTVKAQHSAPSTRHLGPSAKLR